MFGCHSTSSSRLYPPNYKIIHQPESSKTRVEEQLEIEGLSHGWFPDQSQRYETLCKMAYFSPLSLDCFVLFLTLLAGVLLNLGKPYETHPGCCQNKLFIIWDAASKSVPSSSIFCFVTVPLGFIQNLPRGKEAHIVHAASGYLPQEGGQWGFLMWSGRGYGYHYREMFVTAQFQISLWGCKEFGILYCIHYGLRVREAHEGSVFTEWGWPTAFVPACFNYGFFKCKWYI